MLRMPQPNIQTGICPHCANSVAADALTCPYCKNDFLQPAEPEWPRRDEDFERRSPSVENQKLTVRSKASLILGLIVFALGIYLVGGKLERTDLGPVIEEQKRTLAEKDAKIQALEKELADLRQETQSSKAQIDKLKAKLQASASDLVAAQKKLNNAKNELDRLAAVRRRVAATATPAVSPATGSALRSDTVAPGTYETVRSASVYEGPARSSRVVTQIAKGTQVTVVHSIGTWLEIQSKHGNPPGFVQLDDVALIRRSSSSGR